MDYRKEIDDLRSQRRKYFPLMRRLIEAYRNTPQGRSQRTTIEGVDDMLIVLELLEVGYLEPEAFYVKRSFEDIESVHYIGRYPLTEAGEAALRREESGSGFIQWLKRTLIR